MPRSNKVAKLGVITAVIALMMAFGGCGPSSPPLDTLTLLPTDAKSTCVVSPTLFATWFAPIAPATTGVVAVNGVVNPANSVSFSNVPNCSFYQWAKQDFLWLTSPAPPSYGGGGGLIMDSPSFFDVSPPASDFSRTFLRHSSGFIRPFGLRAAQAGPQGLQLLFDRSGRPFQFKLAPAKAKPLVRSVTGETVEIANVRVEKGKAILLDANSKVIQAQPSKGMILPEDRAPINSQVPTMITAEEFMIHGFPIFIDPSLAVIDVEQGEAAGTNPIGSGVLEAQTAAGGSLVYYATIVNDVYAYYTTAVLDHAISLGSDGICTPLTGITCFPTTQSQLNQITAFATAHGETFPDPTALAIEVKSAWVVAAGLPNNASSYITMNATIPVYNPAPPPPSGTTTMTATGGQQTVKLALVGMHVVGSVAGHPEMIWSTFEHVANTPAATYTYINASNATATVLQNAATLPVISGVSAPWVFSSTTATSFNNPHMSFNSPPNIAGNPTISPSDTIRWKAFGAATDVRPNPLDASTAASNSEIIAINNSITGMSAFSGDVRNNYVMTGATWTVNGGPPIGFGNNFPSCGVTTGCPVGTSALSNTTMETYQQGADNTLANGGSNCFTCHGTNTTGVSHVFGALKPLF
jgi:hypothetical protein